MKFPRVMYNEQNAPVLVKTEEEAEGMDTRFPHQRGKGKPTPFKVEKKDAKK